MQATQTVQSADELNRFYASTQDPWSYDNNPDDIERRGRLLSLLPRTEFARTLDIGCGNGFITQALPGNEIVGTDISDKAVDWANRRLSKEPDGRFRFLPLSIFDHSADRLGTFDLIIITGVLYPQYIGRASRLIQIIIDSVLRPGGTLVSCHISEWCGMRFPYAMIDMSYYQYRDYTHRLEVYKK